MSRRETFADGKIPHRVLSDLISRITRPGREVIVGPAIGEDAFAVGVGRTAVVGTTDPITFTAEHPGYYAVNVNANDVATMGAWPRWFMATLLAPRGTRRRHLAAIFEEIDRTCVAVGARLVGGHTEVTSAVTRPVVVGAMLGTVERQKLVVARRARPGDALLLTKRLAIEGTSIIARTRKREVEAVLGARAARRAREIAFKPGISVVREALAAVAAAPVHAMHDPTEGGLIWGLEELAQATGLGFEVGGIPIYEETARIAGHFGINPLGLIASGSLVIAVAPRAAARVIEAVRGLGVECTRIGKLGGRSPALVKDGRRVRWPRLRADEITRVIEGLEGHGGMS